MLRKYVGIDLGSQTIKIAQVSAGLRKNTVVAQASIGVPADAQSQTFAARLEIAITLLRERGWLTMPCALVLPAGVGSYRLLHFPFSDPKRIAQTVPFEVDGKFAVDVEDLVFDHLVVASSEKKGLAFVAGVKRELVDHALARAQAVGMDLRVISTTPLALAQLPGLGPKLGRTADGAGRCSLILDIGHRMSEVALVGEKGLVAARSFRFGGSTLDRGLRKVLGAGLGQDELEELKSDPKRVGVGASAGSLAPVVQEAFEPLVRELSRTQQWLHAECNYEIVEARLTGATAKIPGLAEWLTIQLGMPVVPLAVPEIDSARGIDTQMWVACGAAIGAARRPVLQLLDESARSGGDFSWLGDRVRTIALLGVFVLASGAIATWTRVKAMERQRDAYAVELDALSRDVFGVGASSLADVNLRLSMAEDGGEASVIPRSSAAQVLAMLVKVSLPDAAGEAGAGEGLDATSTTETTTATTTTATGTGTGTETAALPPVALDRGIVADDELYFRSVDIRDTKISINVAATRASAKDRLKRKIESIPCVKLVTPGTMRDYNRYKAFGFEIDHDCFHQPGLEVEQ